jgi:hypothetical protein
MIIAYVNLIWSKSIEYRGAVYGSLKPWQGKQMVCNYVDITLLKP